MSWNNQYQLYKLLRTLRERVSDGSGYPAGTSRQGGPRSNSGQRGPGGCKSDGGGHAQTIADEMNIARENVWISVQNNLFANQF